MCGRFTIALNQRLLFEFYDSILPAVHTSAAVDHSPRFNVSPTQSVPVLMTNEDGPAVAPMRWGLVPSWAKDSAIGNRMINARGETVAEKPSFRSAFKRRRCLIAADGFYEWQKCEDGKQPMHIRRTDREPFTFAGLWEHWTKDDSPLTTFTILTTEPNELMAPIHDRMPVILSGDARNIWLDAETEPSALHEFIGPCDPDGWEAVPVSRTVNNPRNDAPECLEPI